MKLYYSRGACSLAPHIILRETGLQFQLERVDLTKHQLASGEDYYKINARGQVPLLELDDGQKITEGPVITQYLAERAGRKDLLPPSGELDRYRVLEWQNFITSELHKSYSPLFSKDYPEEAKSITRRALRKKYEWVSQQLNGRDYTTGNNFTVADAYLFTVTNWAKGVDLNLSDLDALQAFQKRVANRPAVIEAIRAEELNA
jgi:glutathione S-transferase